MTEKQSQIKEHLVGQQPSKFSVSKKDLLMITKLDNRATHGSDAPSEASNIIMKQYNGPQGLAKILRTNIDTGIDNWNDQERTDRVQSFGPNSFPPPKIKTLWELVMENFDDQINRILLGAAIVSIVIGLVQHGWPDGMLEGTSIMIALCIIIVVSSSNNYASERRLANLVAMADRQEVAVYRKGTNDETTTISYEDLVVGDLVELSKGMKCPADCMLVNGQNVKCKEDALTGEPDEILKQAIDPNMYDRNIGQDAICFAKSEVSNGKGVAIVLAVGDVTEAGKIMKKVQEEGEDAELTLLQQKLNKIANQIGNVGYGCAALTFVAIVIRLILEASGAINCGCKNLITCEAPELVNNEIQGCDELNLGDVKNRFYTELLNTVIIAITVIVVAIPEGLPLAVTISLSFSSAKMQKENNLVRKLASAETMGSVTHICSDKTGTLTQNIMTAMACMSHQQLFKNPSEDRPDVAALSSSTKAGIGQNGWQLLSECAIWNNEARIEVPEEAAKGFTGTATKQFEYQGNVTDQGILKFFAGQMGIEGVRNKMMELTSDLVLTSIPFDSKFKRATVAVRRPDGGVRIYTKGAPDVLYGKDKPTVDALIEKYKTQGLNLTKEQALARAEKDAGYGLVSHVAVNGGTEDWKQQTTNTMPLQSLNEILALTGRQGQPEHEDVYQATVKDFANQAYRTILCCYKDISMPEYEKLKRENNNFLLETDRQILERDLVAIGLFGIQDPLRDTIVSSVNQVVKAGIKVIMCTGDNLDTATAISKNAGIVTQAQIDAHPQWSRMEGKDFREVVGGLKKLRDVNCKETDPKKQKFTEYVGKQNVFNQVIKHLRVLARSSPEDKYLLVTGLQASPYTGDDETKNDLEVANANKRVNYCSVAVTGDGTNDAPALSKANVGFSMGITGTDIAKGASDIILLDDNFASIITALKYGRNIYDNVRKFLQFQLTVNIVAMFIVFFGSLMLSDSPLNAVQMLWVNLIMDTLAALALATEPPDLNILERMPQPSSDSIVTEIMWRNVDGHAIYQMLILIVIIFCGQGFLVQKYDVKCLLERPNDGNGPCPALGLNPFYAGNLYNELETQVYWETLKATPANNKAGAFEQTAWVDYQCALLNQYEDLGDTVCTADNYKALLTAHVAKDLSDEEKALLSPDGYLPQNAAAGDGTEKLLHMTYVFQIFVFMQIFNQMNARLLTGDLNIFGGICRNWLFVAVSFSTFIIQMAMVEVGGRITKTYPLEMWRNGICLLFGSGELIWGLFIKFLPLNLFQCINFDEKPMTDEEYEKSTMGRMKKGSSVHKKSAKAEKMEQDVGNAMLAKVKAQMAENQAKK